MPTEPTDPVPPALDVEKHTSTHQEYSEKEFTNTAVDYSGAAAKTDPAEIKLVRKLDLWVMVSGN
jgi:hypothetical protein